MSHDKFTKNSFIVVLSNLATGISGFAFFILLSKKLGTEGLGLYGLIMPVYILFLCLVSDGLTTGISKVSAVYYDKHDFNNLKRTIETFLVATLLWSSAVALFVIFNAPYISSHIIKDDRSLKALIIISPAFLSLSFSAALKGYFYGISRFSVPALIDVGEKVFRIAALVGMAGILPSRTIEQSVTIAFFSLTLGEFVSAIALFSFYRILKNPSSSITIYKPQKRIKLLFDVLKISIPLCLNGILLCLFSAISALILPKRLMSTGISYNSALSLIGEFTRMAQTIVTFPIIIIGSISIVLIPNLSLSLNRKNYKTIEHRVGRFLRVSSLIGIFTLTLCLSIPTEIGELFYQRGDLGPFIKFASLSSIFAFISLPTIGIMNGLGKQNLLLRNSIIVAAGELGLTYLLTGIPVLNICGVGITSAITSLTMLMLNFKEIKKVCSIKPLLPILIKHLFVGLLSYLILKLLASFIPNTIFIFKTIATGILCMALVYLFAKLLGEDAF
jgi:stage V sporulation protein B